MSVELFFQIAGLLGAFVTALWALVKVIDRQQQKSQEERFNGLATSIASVSANLTAGLEKVSASLAEEQKTTQRLERELLLFKAELPRDYVRREDYIRTLGIIEAKIDNMALRVERAMLKTPPRS